MVSALANLDLSVLREAVAVTQNSELGRAVVTFVAEYLIFVFPLVLLWLWWFPEIRAAQHGAQKAVILAVMALVLALALKSGLGFYWARLRPFVSHPELFHLPFRVDAISFPSGHTLIAFSLATSLLFSGFRGATWFLLIAAVLIGLSRVFAGVHYPSDVIAGAILGTCCAWYLHREASSLKRYLPNH